MGPNQRGAKLARGWGASTRRGCRGMRMQRAHVHSLGVKYDACSTARGHGAEEEYTPGETPYGCRAWAGNRARRHELRPGQARAASYRIAIATSPAFTRRAAYRATWGKFKDRRDSLQHKDDAYFSSINKTIFKHTATHRCKESKQYKSLLGVSSGFFQRTSPPFRAAKEDPRFNEFRSLWTLRTRWDKRFQGRPPIIAVILTPSGGWPAAATNSEFRARLLDYSSFDSRLADREWGVRARDLVNRV
ncbi:hypothetical protein C8R47DRAFT_1192141 [Mycena vitilis]|nr:hypothetical protein C8R47DRAFT_1192141 [Mycena vitilis]